MSKYGEFANCSICRRAPGTGNGACPFRETWYEERAKQERHECVSFKPISDGSLAKRRAAAGPPVEQPGLF